MACANQDVPQGGRRPQESAALQSSNSPANLQLREEFRIGSRDDSATALTAIGQITVGPDGSLHVQQPRELLIRVFDSGGRFVRTIGRSGRGPGEFEMLNAIGWVVDTLYAIDYSLRRVTQFTPDGAHIGSFPIFYHAGSDRSSGIPPIALLQDGLLLARTEPVGGVSATLRVSRRGAVHDTLHLLALPHVSLAGSADDGPFSLRQPLSDRALFAHAPDGTSAAMIEWNPDSPPDVQPTFRVSRWNFGENEGGDVVVREYPFEPEPVPTTVVDSIVSVLAERRVERVGGPRPLFRNSFHGERVIRQLLYVPRFDAPVTAAVVGNDGTIWLRRGRRSPEVESRWQVLSADGDVLGDVHLPPSQSLAAATREYALAVYTDELDVPYVVRYRVVQ
jgi:hypothetical protein